MCWNTSWWTANLGFSCKGSKVAHVVFALSKLKNILPINAKITIYNLLFRSFIEFGICAWGKQINRIISLQKRAMRCIVNDNDIQLSLYWLFFIFKKSFTLIGDLPVLPSPPSFGSCGSVAFLWLYTPALVVLSICR